MKQRSHLSINGPLTASQHTLTTCQLLLILFILLLLLLLLIMNKPTQISRILQHSIPTPPHNLDNHYLSPFPPPSSPPSPPPIPDSLPFQLLIHTIKYHLIMNLLQSLPLSPQCSKRQLTKYNHIHDLITIFL